MLIVEQDARDFMAGALDNKVVVAVAIQAETFGHLLKKAIGCWKGYP